MQTADALDRAHRSSVLHRDVKPKNMMLTRDGLKVLDFGLDIFGFRCVVYDMVTGNRAFDGKTCASVVAAIVVLDPAKKN